MTTQHRDSVRIFAAFFAIWSLLALDPAHAQQAENAKVDETAYPAIIKVAKVDGGFRYTNAEGRTLYMLDPRDARQRRGNALEYCVAECAVNFTPLAAEASDAKVGLWKAENNSRGRVWTYKGSPVFTFNSDAKPGDVGAEGYDDIFSTIPYVPRAPRSDAPAPAVPRYHKGQWFLADNEGRYLVTRDKDEACGDGCTSGRPFVAGAAALPTESWSVLEAGDQRQWAYRGRSVYVMEKGAAMPTTGDGTPIVVSPERLGVK